MDLLLVFLVGALFAVAAAAPAIWLKMVMGRQQKEAKRDFRHRLQRIEDESMDALFAIDELGVVRSFNNAAEKLFGYRADDILYRSVGLIIPHAGPSEAGFGINALLSAPKTRNGQGIQVQGQRKDGKVVPLDLRLSEHVRRGRRVFHAVARDLSDKQTAERCAREVQFLEGCLHSAGAPVLVVNPDGVIVRHNRSFEEMTGFSPEEVENRLYWELLLPNADWTRGKSAIAHIIASNAADRGEYLWKNKAGEMMRVYGAITPLVAGNARPEYAVIVGFESKGETAGGGTATLDAVERLAGGIAQQFSDLITSINGYSELALHGLTPGDPARHDIEQIKKAGERAAGLTSQLLAFSGRQPMKASIFNLNHMVAEMKEMLDMLLGDRIKVSTIMDLELWPLRADQNWMEQVILNIAVNARDAMPEGGKLSIETQNVYLDAPTARRTAQLAEGEYILLSMSDTGVGIDPAVRRHLFEPFYTTKKPGKGLGLGLSTVYGVVRQSGGNVVVQSIPGTGTSLKIYLPRYVETAQSETPSRLFLVRGAGAGS
jgi:two-component system, cell cycle sensor histidine kinase and response regulator CckA